MAIVGSRAATEYARQVGERLGAELARRGVVVPAGWREASTRRPTAGCLGWRRAPRLPSSAAAWIGSTRPSTRIWPQVFAEQGALVSELGPGAPPLPEHFPLRNRIISGISLAVVVVEASEKSGSLITARYALEHGRDVMAVPGTCLSGRNRGSHGLLKDGAKVVESADDILEELGWLSPEAGRATGGEGPRSRTLSSREWKPARFTDSTS